MVGRAVPTTVASMAATKSETKPGHNAIELRRPGNTLDLNAHGLRLTGRRPLVGPNKAQKGAAAGGKVIVARWSGLSSELLDGLVRRRQRRHKAFDKVITEGGKEMLAAQDSQVAPSRS